MKRSLPSLRTLLVVLLANAAISARAQSGARWLWVGTGSDIWGNPISQMHYSWALYPGSNSAERAPNSSRDDVNINVHDFAGSTPGTAAAKIELGGNYTVGRLILGPDSSLTTPGGSRLRTLDGGFAGGGNIINNGTLFLKGDNNGFAELWVGAPGMNHYGDTGTIDMSSTGNFPSAIEADYQAAGSFFIVYGGTTIRGAGQIGGGYFGRTLRITNDNGLINANLPQQSLDVFLNDATGSSLTNTRGAFCAPATAALCASAFPTASPRGRSSMTAVSMAASKRSMDPLFALMPGSRWQAAFFIPAAPARFAARTRAAARFWSARTMAPWRSALARPSG